MRYAQKFPVHGTHSKPYDETMKWHIDDEKKKNKQNNNDGEKEKWTEREREARQNQKENERGIEIEKRGEEKKLH